MAEKSLQLYTPPPCSKDWDFHSCADHIFPYQNYVSCEFHSENEYIKREHVYMILLIINTLMLFALVDKAAEKFHIKSSGEIEIWQLPNQKVSNLHLTIIVICGRHRHPSSSSS